MTHEPATPYDVVIVGGGAGGLSAAVTLGRSRRRVLVIDAGEPRNAASDGVHNLLTRDGIEPLELTRLGRAEAERYGVEIVADTVTRVDRDGERFLVHAADRAVLARRLIVATGTEDLLPDIEGLPGRWGRDAVHCPYCHGWEIRDRAVVVLGTGPAALHQTQLFRQWSDDVTVVLDTAPDPDAAMLETFAARGIRVVRGGIRSLRIVDDAITGVVLDDGRVVSAGAVVVGAPVRPRTRLLEQLGAETETGVSGTVVSADATGRTTVPVVWVVGNAREPMAIVVAAAAAGVGAAAAINFDLVEEDQQLAVAAARAE